MLMNVLANLGDEFGDLRERDWQHGVAHIFQIQPMLERIMLSIR